MPQEQKFKRHTAYKLRVGDVLIGKPVTNNTNGVERFSFLELGSKQVFRVNIAGNIVDRYDAEQSQGSEGSKKYIFFTLDDGSGQIKLKVFGDDSDRFKDVSQGQTVIVIGTLKHWNNELYINPEIIKETAPKYLLLRKIETEKNKSNLSHNPQADKEQVMAIKDKVLDIVKSAEEDGGIDLENLIKQLNDFSPGIINQEIQKLLEEGIVFEPRPGKIRYLG